MRIYRFLGLLALAAYLAIPYTSIANRAARALAAAPDLQPCDAIVVLGSGMSGDGVLTGPSFSSAVSGVILARRGLAPVVLLLGMKAFSGVSEADMRARLARDLGLPEQAILTDSQGRTTHEEAARARALLAPRGVRRILLVAAPLHLPRAKAAFERAGLESHAVPASNVSLNTEDPDERFQLIRNVLSEFLARRYYRITGRL